MCQLWHSMQAMGRVAERYTRFLQHGQLAGPRDACGRDVGLRGTQAYALSRAGAAHLTALLHQHERALMMMAAPPNTPASSSSSSSRRVLDVRGVLAGVSAEALVLQLLEEGGVWVANYPMFRDMDHTFHIR